MRKILICTSHFSPNVGGVETHLNDLVRALVKRKWHVVVSCYQPLARNMRMPFHDKKKNLDIYRMYWPGFNIVHKLTPYPILEFIYLFPGLFLVTLYSVMKHRDVKTIHAQGLVPGVVSFILSKVAGKKCIVSTHNLYFFTKDSLYTKFTSYIFSNVNKILTLSNASKNEILSIGVNKKKVGDFRYWLDLETFKPAKNHISKKDFTVFFVGRLILTKGVGELLKSSSDKRLSKVKFVFAGMGPLQSDVEKLAEENRNVVYLGPLEPSRVRESMVKANVVCVPSTVDEGYGRVAMEAISCGTPVLAGDVGGLREAVSDDIGWLVSPNSKDLSDKIYYLLSNRKEVEQKTKRTRAYALEYFSEKNVEQIIRHYK